MESSNNIGHENPPDRSIFRQPETNNHEPESDSDRPQQSNIDDVLIEQFKVALDKGRRDREAQREWLKGRDLQPCLRCRFAGVACTTNSGAGAKCDPCRVQGPSRSLQCSQFDAYLINYIAKFLNVSESRSRDLFRDHGTKGSKHRIPMRTSGVENQSDRESYKTKEEVEALVKETVELRVQVERLERQSQALRAEKDGFEKQVSDLLEECEKLKRKEEETERSRQRYKKKSLDLFAANANATTKREELERELAKMRMDHNRNIEQKGEENRLLVEQHQRDVGNYSAEAKRRERELAALRTENENLQKTVIKVPELEEKLDELRQRFSDEQQDMVRFQLRIDQVAAILQCTLTPEKLETVKDGRIVKTTLEELKKITQECVMSRVSRGDDVFEVGRTLLTLGSNGKNPETESTNKRGLDTAEPPKSALGNKRQRLTED